MEPLFAVPLDLAKQVNVVELVCGSLELSGRTQLNTSLNRFAVPLSLAKQIIIAEQLCVLLMAIDWTAFQVLHLDSSTNPRAK
jgi:hypothetical protein